MNRIMVYWPPLYDDILDFIELAKTEGIEFDSLEQAVEQFLNDQFVLTSNVQSIRRRERMLDIQADPSTESLTFRKRRILNRYQTKPPFTIRYLQHQLDFLLGPGRALAEVDVQNFLLIITTSIDDANVFKELEHTIRTIKPANLDYQQKTALEDLILLEEHIKRQEITWNYKLDGTWKLGEKPFSSLGPEVIVK